ncbi:transposase zinc-binding domain-containing protein [Candidatus Poribacteria bacterium]|nr:transposase zinc-binding domain-containing protein [Candidatus Poribacteria bacterium]
MNRPQIEVADIFRKYGAAYRQTHALPINQLRVMHAIEICRTKILGGHVDKCNNNDCAKKRISYNSCRIRLNSISSKRMPPANIL